MINKQMMARPSGPPKQDGLYKPKCGTELARSYFIPARVSQRGDGQAPAFRVTRCRTWSEGRGEWSGWILSGHARILQGSDGSVSQSYTAAGQSSNPPRPIAPCRAISGPDGFLSEPYFGTTGPDAARRIARLTRVVLPLLYGPLQDPTSSTRVLRGLLGPDGRPADRHDTIYRYL